LYAYRVEPTFIAWVILAVVNIQDAIQKPTISKKLQVVTCIQLVDNLAIPIIRVAVRWVVSTLWDVFEDMVAVPVVSSFVVESVTETRRREQWERSDVIYEGLEKLASVVLLRHFAGGSGLCAVSAPPFMAVRLDNRSSFNLYPD
jgi:hypothetical protein